MSDTLDLRKKCQIFYHFPCLVPPPSTNNFQKRNALCFSPVGSGSVMLDTHDQPLLYVPSYLTSNRQKQYTQIRDIENGRIIN